MAKYHPRGINPAAPQENFALYYSFGQKDKVPARMQGVVSKWQYQDACRPHPEGCPYDIISAQERKFVKGSASGYGHGVGQRAGKLRTSGKAGAHRIGKR